jgi:hypothetical protein
MAGAFRDFEAWNALARMAEVWLRLADDWDDASNRLRQSNARSGPFYERGRGAESRRHSLAKSDPGDHARPLRLRAAAYFAGNQIPILPVVVERRQMRERL